MSASGTRRAVQARVRADNVRIMKYRVLIVSALVLFGVRQCADDPARANRFPIERDYIGPERVQRVAPSQTERERRECEGRLRDVLQQPAVPGAAGFEAKRAELLARAKAEPVLFTETPEYDDAKDVSLPVQGYRKMLQRTSYPWDTVKRLLAQFKGRPRPARDALLRDGYLYAENPELAYALVSLVQPQDLFGHDEIWIQRGERTFSAERKRGLYYYKTGPLEGQRVRLLHLDRIGHGTPDPEPLHLDLRALQHRLHFQELKVRHVSETAMVANLRYDRWWVPSVLSTDGARVELECEVLAPSIQQKVAEAKRLSERRSRAVQALRATILEQIDEGLPFDEPHHEYGHQLDGKLRQNWLYAYMMKRNSFAFNGDLYLVFDSEGRPNVPQVCVDFLTDTFERASGTWWTPRGQVPRRIIGKLDFHQLETLDRDALRQIPAFLDLARSKPDWFEVYDASPPDLFVRMGYPKRFYPYLREHVDDFRPGDIIIIRGKTPWDWRRAHYHSFFVYESDPVTGMPLIVAGNAGRPSLRSWETEARRTPRRSIHHRIRPKVEWLESIIAHEPPKGPLPLAAGPT